MHELSLAAAIVRIAERNAQGRRVVRVELEVGRLRQVVPEALEFAFGLVANGTPAEGAELALEEVPVRVRCRACDAETTTAQDFPLACASCGALDVEVTAGEELQVVGLELEEVETEAAGCTGRR